MGVLDPNNSPGNTHYILVKTALPSTYLQEK